MSGPIPEWIVTAVVAVTVFTVMFGVGSSIAPGELRWIWQRPGPMVRGLFSGLVAVPAVAIVVTDALDLPRAVTIGIVLMSISPGAPVALRRSLGAGGHHAFAPSLQISVAALAVLSMPLSIAALNHVYAGQASVDPWDVARQVFVAQLLPLGLGMGLRGLNAPLAARLEPRLAGIGTVLLVVTLVVVLIDLWDVMVSASALVLATILLVTVGALVVGHLLGGPEPATRTAVAITSAARNPGLALLVATVNNAPPPVIATVLAYLVVSVFAIVPYVAWRRRGAPARG